MSASPASMMTNPSPQSQLIPSPASRHANAGIPSPSSTSLNTPGILITSLLIYVQLHINIHVTSIAGFRLIICPSN